MYSIGFYQVYDNVPSNIAPLISLYKNVMSDCASSSENYYEVNNTDNIEIILSAVANDITKNDFVPYFSHSTTVYNHNLAILAAKLSSLAYNANDIFDMLLAMGFNSTDISQLNYEAYDDHVGSTIANRTITIGGVTKNLIIVAIHGTKTGQLHIDEIINNFQLGAYENTADSLYDDFMNLIPSNTLENIILVTGHSQGASVANLLAAKLNEGNTYAYTFAAPTATDMTVGYRNIFNIISEADGILAILSKLGPGQWFRHGKNLFIPASHNIPHDMGRYLNWLMANPGLTESDWNNIPIPTPQPSRSDLPQLVTVKCPVDVIVRNNQDDVVATIVNGVATNRENSDTVVFVSGDVKYIMLPTNGNYTVELIGTDDGTMEYSVQTIDISTNETVEYKEFVDVELYDGKTMRSELADDIPNTQLLITEDDKITGLIDENGIENDNISVITFDKNGGDTEASPAIKAIASSNLNAAKIYTPQDLWNVRNNLNGSYVLMNDLDLSSFNGGEWVPIGDYSIYSNDTQFTGVFDGNGYVISNLKITGNYNSAGLFGAVLEGELLNINLRDTFIDAFSSLYEACAGGVCGRSSNSIITNCSNTGSLFVSLPNSNASSFAGGICGYSYYSTIDRCCNTANVKSKSGDGYSFAE